MRLLFGAAAATIIFADRISQIPFKIFTQGQNAGQSRSPPKNQKQNPIGNGASEMGRNKHTKKKKEKKQYSYYAAKNG